MFKAFLYNQKTQSLRCKEGFPPTNNQQVVSESHRERTKKGHKVLSPSFDPRQYEIKTNNQAPFLSHNSSSSQNQAKPNLSHETQVIILRLLLAADVADEVLPAGLLRSASPVVLRASFGIEECLRWDRGAGAEGLVVVESVLVVEAGEEEDVSLKS